jgi:hypothetical protein
MKITRSPLIFTPVNLVIESEAELNLLVSLLGNIAPNLVIKITGKQVDLTTIYKELKSHCITVPTIKLNIIEGE